MNESGRIAGVIGVLFGLFGTGVQADRSVLNRYVGSWEVRVKTLHPAKPDLTYTEVYEWVLDRHFIRGKTGKKSDGFEDIIYGTYDAKSDGYPFWIFSSSGDYTYLPPATWNGRRQLMEWKNPSGWDINCSGSCLFPDNNTRRCSLIMQDWKGKVLLQQEWTASRIMH